MSCSNSRASRIEVSLKVLLIRKEQKRKETDPYRNEHRRIDQRTSRNTAIEENVLHIRRSKVTIPDRDESIIVS
jgi:hypothetical protein